MLYTVVVAAALSLGSLFWGADWAGAPSPPEATAGSLTGEVITLKIEGWTCASCEKELRRALLAAALISVPYWLGL